MNDLALQPPKNLKYENLIIKIKINFRLKNLLKYIKEHQVKKNYMGFRFWVGFLVDPYTYLAEREEGSEGGSEMAAE